MFTYFTEQSGREILHCWYLYLSTDFKSVTDELDHCRLSYVSLPDDLSVKPNFKDSQVENAINQIKIELTPVKEPEISHLRSRKQSISHAEEESEDEIEERPQKHKRKSKEQSDFEHESVKQSERNVRFKKDSKESPSAIEVKSEREKVLEKELEILMNRVTQQPTSPVQPQYPVQPFNAPPQSSYCPTQSTYNATPPFPYPLQSIYPPSQSPSPTQSMYNSLQFFEFFCPKCGIPMYNNDFCVKCGHKHV